MPEVGHDQLFVNVFQRHEIGFVDAVCSAWSGEIEGTEVHFLHSVLGRVKKWKALGPADQRTGVIDRAPVTNEKRARCGRLAGPVGCGDFGLMENLLTSLHRQSPESFSDRFSFHLEDRNILIAATAAARTAGQVDAIAVRESRGQGIHLQNEPRVSIHCLFPLCSKGPAPESAHRLDLRGHPLIASEGH